MDTIVTTTHGRLRGSIADGVHRFLGIPFAASTAGANRLRPPQPVQPWSGVRDAIQYGAAPFQLAPPESAGTEWDTALAGEDCLNLNVWTPDHGSRGLPVMVWIQGGAFEIGSTAAYNGTNFARDGVVCVVINWRVGADGFLDLGDGQANIGLLDQVAALEWVRDNIAAFGGDPANVTVFGQSAGAMSIGVLLSMPRAEGLFRRAILQSGAAHHALPTQTAQRIGGFLSEKLGVPQTREAMAAVPVQRFLAAQTELKADLAARPDPARWGPEVVASSMLWQPTVDGDIIPRSPIERIAAGAGSTVDVMVGSNTEDWKLFLAITGVIAKVTERDLAESRSVDGIARIPVPLSGQYSRRAACRRGNRLVGADSGATPGGCPREGGVYDVGADVHVRICLGRPRPWRSPRRGSAVRIRHPGHGFQALRTAAWNRPAAGTG